MIRISKSTVQAAPNGTTLRTSATCSTMAAVELDLHHIWDLILSYTPTADTLGQTDPA